MTGDESGHNYMPHFLSQVWLSTRFTASDYSQAFDLFTRYTTLPLIALYRVFLSLLLSPSVNLLIFLIANVYNVYFLNISWSNLCNGSLSKMG